LKKKSKWDVGSLFKLVNYLKKEKPAVVHTQLFLADFMGRLAAKLAGIKVIISTEQNLNFSEGEHKRVLKKLTAPLATAIVAISTAVKNYSIEFEGGNPEKIIIIPNGIEINKFLYSERNFEVSDAIKIGFIGRLTEQKGIEYLIEALAKIKTPYHCYLAGDGPLKEKLNAQIKTLNLQDKVELIGWQKNTPEFLRKIDIFVLPSRWEGLGIVVLEAGLAQLPVVASDVDGIKDIIVNNKNGLLFKSGDSQELAGKLNILINDADKRKSMAQALQQSVKEKFDIKKITYDYEELYLKLLNKNQ
jgi:glycosyltransferase involved in cell wall biosynthesis